jgi:hypothetical protein
MWLVHRNNMRQNLLKTFLSKCHYAPNLLLDHVTQYLADGDILNQPILNQPLEICISMSEQRKNSIFSALILLQFVLLRLGITKKCASVLPISIKGS